MLEFVRKAYKDSFVIGLWINLIGCVIAGYYLGREFDIAFWGLIIGGIVGIMINIYVGGAMATFIKIGDDITKIAVAVGADVKPENDISKEFDKFESSVQYFDDKYKNLNDEKLLEMYKTPEQFTDAGFAAIKEEVAKRGLVVS